jgi:hypothetical protein
VRVTQALSLRVKFDSAVGRAGQRPAAFRVGSGTAAPVPLASFVTGAQTAPDGASWTSAASLRAFALARLPVPAPREEAERGHSTMATYRHLRRHSRRVPDDEAASSIADLQPRGLERTKQGVGPVRGAGLPLAPLGMRPRARSRTRSAKILTPASIRASRRALTAEPPSCASPPGRPGTSTPGACRGRRGQGLSGRGQA